MSETGAAAPLERRFETRDALNAALATDIVATLTAAVGARGAASLVASGGTTPGPLYDRLRGMAAPWERVTVTLADERWVAPESPLSNERLIRAHLIRDRASRATFVPLKTADAEPEPAEPAVDAALRAIARPFDLTLLGLGENGHTASLFPHAQGLEAALNTADPALARAVRPVPPDEPSPPRMSMSLRALLDTRRIVFLFTGAPKWAVYRKLLEPGDVRDLPARAVLRRSEAPIEVWWAP